MWFDLGDALDLPPSILDDIRGQFETNPQQCMIEMVDAWLQRHLSRGSPTWTEVAEALRKINQNGLANALENVYYTGRLERVGVTVHSDIKDYSVAHFRCNATFKVLYNFWMWYIGTRCLSLVPRPRFSPHTRPGYEAIGAYEPHQ